MTSTKFKDIFKIPKGFKAHKGRSSTDMPQALFALKDFDIIEVFYRDGTRAHIQLYGTDWTASYLKTDIIAWRIEDVSENQTAD